MSKEFSAYKELVLDVHNGKSGKWIARIYNRTGPATMLATKSGEAKSYEAARDAATKWADAQLEKYRITPKGEAQVITKDDIGVLHFDAVSGKIDIGIDK